LSNIGEWVRWLKSSSGGIGAVVQGFVVHLAEVSPIVDSPDGAESWQPVSTPAPAPDPQATLLIETLFDISVRDFYKEFLSDQVTDRLRPFQISHPFASGYSYGS
jgi:hypothetical protein